MSGYTKSALYDILSEDTELVESLGSDENSDPAIFNATYNQITAELAETLTTSLYPIVTFREDNMASDMRFSESSVRTEYWSIEVWARTESGLTVPNILKHIKRLLHQQSITLDSGYTFESVLISESPDQYDSVLKLHFGLARYRLIVKE